MKLGNTQTSLFLKQWHDGDGAGLNALLERHLPWVQDQVRRRMGPVLRKKGETIDYVQDAMVEFLQYAPRFNVSDDDHFRALLLRVVENTLHHRYDWFTARRRAFALEKPLPPDSVLNLDPHEGAVTTPSNAAMHHEEEAWVSLGLELLGPDYREVLVLRKWDGLSFAKIGERLRISEVAARMKHNRAVLKLSEKVLDLRSGNLARALEDEPS